MIRANRRHRNRRNNITIIITITKLLQPKLSETGDLRPTALGLAHASVCCRVISDQILGREVYSILTRVLLYSYL